MRSFTHLGVYDFCPRILTTQTVLDIPYGSSSYCMLISPPILPPLASCESARVSRSCFSVTSWIHHTSLLRPPPLYPVSLVHTSNKGRSGIALLCCGTVLYGRGGLLGSDFFCQDRNILQRGFTLAVQKVMMRCYGGVVPCCWSYIK